MKLQGNTILVTGGGSGIGRALARRFQALGNTVIVAGRRAEALVETIGDRDGMVAMTFDATDAESVTRFAAALLARFPDLNVLINNAGVMRIESIASKRDLGATEETIAANLLGPIRMIDALVDHLTARPDAAIVNVTSGLAFVPRASAAVYSATKAAIHSFTVSLRLQLEGKVEVIELAPPGVQTDLTPGQSHREGYMPLDEFIEEVMSLFQQRPTPPEILVQRVHRQRWAERDGTFDGVASMLSKL